MKNDSTDNLSAKLSQFRVNNYLTGGDYVSSSQGFKGLSVKKTKAMRRYLCAPTSLSPWSQQSSTKKLPPEVVTHGESVNIELFTPFRTMDPVPSKAKRESSKESSSLSKQDAREFMSFLSNTLMRKTQISRNSYTSGRIKSTTGKQRLGVLRVSQNSSLTNGVLGSKSHLKLVVDINKGNSVEPPTTSKS